MKKLMMLLMGIMIAGMMVSGCGQKQEAAQEGAPAVEQAAPGAPAEQAPATRQEVLEKIGDRWRSWPRVRSLTGC